MKLRKSSRFLSLVLSAVMVLAMLPAMSGTAEAAGEIVTRTTPLDLTKNEVTYAATDGTTKTVDPKTTSITDTKEGWSWHYHGRLTLDGANIDCSGQTYGSSSSAISMSMGLSIYLAPGSVNTVKGPNVTGAGSKSWGIHSPERLFIYDTGTLNVTGGDATARSCGMGADAGYIFIKNGNINATGGSAELSYGIDGEIDITTGTGIATGRTQGFFMKPCGDVGKFLTNYREKTVSWPAVPVISFDARNGSTIASATVDGNGKTPLPTAPTWEDYAFAGWYTGIDGTGTAVTANTVHSVHATVYAKWTNGGKTVRTTPLDLTSVATTNKIADEGWSWDSTAKVLTLDGFTLHNIAKKNDLAGEIVLVSGATVDVKGANTVIGKATEGQCLGIVTGAGGVPLSIRGTGILNVTAHAMAITILGAGDITISGSVTVNAQTTGPNGMGIGANGTLTLKDQARVSTKGTSAAIRTTKSIIADGATVTGAKETFTSGTTTQLTQSGADPVVVNLGPPPIPTFDVAYNVVNGKGSGSRLERSLNTVVTDTNKGVTAEDNAGGNKVSLKLTVTETATTATEIEGVKQGDSVQYYDVTVRKTVTTPAGNKTITTLTSIPMPVQAIIPVPADIQGKTSYTVYRIHGGVADKIPHDPTAVEFYTVNPGGTSLTLNVNKFSTYAVITSNKALTGDATFGDAKNPKNSAVDVQGKVIEGNFGVYKLDVSWGAMKFDYNAQGKVWNPVTHVYDATGTKGWIKESFEAGNNKITVANHSNGDVTLSYTATADAILAGATMTVRANNSLTSVLAENLLLGKVAAESNMTAPTVDAYVWLTGEPANLKSATYTKAGVITITAEPDTAGGLTPKTTTP